MFSRFSLRNLWNTTYYILLYSCGGDTTVSIARGGCVVIVIRSNGWYSGVHTGSLFYSNVLTHLWSRMASTSYSSSSSTTIFSTTDLTSTFELDRVVALLMCFFADLTVAVVVVVVLADGFCCLPFRWGCWRMMERLACFFADPE